MGNKMADVGQKAADDSGYPHLFMFNPNPKLLTWERLEAKRLSKLGIPNRYSRHFTIQANMNTSPRREHGVAQSWGGESVTSSVPSTPGPVMLIQAGGVKNSMVPFATEAKPTCGFFFSRQTDHKKKNFGIPPSDLVKWRSNGNSSSTNPQL